MLIVCRPLLVKCATAGLRMAASLVSSGKGSLSSKFQLQQRQSRRRRRPLARAPGDSPPSAFQNDDRAEVVEAGRFVDEILEVLLYSHKFLAVPRYLQVNSRECTYYHGQRQCGHSETLFNDWRAMPMLAARSSREDRSLVDRHRYIRLRDCSPSADGSTQVVPLLEMWGDSLGTTSVCEFARKLAAEGRFIKALDVVKWLKDKRYLSDDELDAMVALEITCYRHQKDFKRAIKYYESLLDEQGCLFFPGRRTYTALMQTQAAQARGRDNGVDGVWETFDTIIADPQATLDARAIAVIMGACQTPEGIKYVWETVMKISKRLGDMDTVRVLESALGNHSDEKLHDRIFIGEGVVHAVMINEYVLTASLDAIGRSARASPEGAKELCEAMYELAQLHGLISNEKVQTALITALGMIDVTEAEKRFQLLLDQYDAVTEPVYNAVAGSYARAGNGPGARTILEVMKENGVRPSVVTYGSVLHAYARDVERYCRNGKQEQTLWNMALEVFAEMYPVAGVQSSDATHSDSPTCEYIAPNEYIFSALMRLAAGAFLEREAQIRVDRVFMWIKRLDTSASMEAIIGALLKAASFRGHWRLARDLIFSIQASQFEAAMELFDLMKRHRVKPDLKVYNIAISACARCRETGKAESLFEELNRTGYLKPNTVTFNTMLSAFAGVGNGKLAVKYFRLLEKSTRECQGLESSEKSKARTSRLSNKRARVEMTDYAFTALFNALGKDGSWQKALEMQAKMKAYGVQPTVHTYNALICACLKGGQFSRAIGLYVRMVNVDRVRPNSSTRLLIEEVGRRGSQAADAAITATSAASTAISVASAFAVMKGII